MACMLFLLYPQKLNQRLFTSTYRTYSVLLNANGREKKSRSEKKVWTKQLIEESGSNDEVISNVRGIIPLAIDQSWMMKWRLEALMIISGMLFILLLELIFHTFLAEQVASDLLIS